MAVERIEQYRQKNGADILKVYTAPTKTFPKGGYFYTPAEAVSLVQRYGWVLYNAFGRDIYICAYDAYRNTIKFHKELFKFYHGYDWNDDIDHISGLGFDNVDENLNAVTRTQNLHNRFTRGYGIYGSMQFTPRIKFNNQEYYPFNRNKRTEDIACKQQHLVDTIWLKEKMGNQYYIFDFKKYRRGSEDILDLERTGKISEEEAIYRHILRYSDNAWYMLRYGLEDYYKQYHIQIPQYRIDRSTGQMVDPVTWKPLCPFNK